MEQTSIMYRFTQTTFLLVVVFLMASCQSPRQDFTDIELTSVDGAISVPNAEYFGPAWLDDNRIAFSYRELGPENHLSDRFIGFAELDTGTWHELSLPPEPEECESAARVVHSLQRLPDGTMGYGYDCYNNGISGILYAWDASQNDFSEIHHFPVPFRIGTYSFAPDMTEYLQVGENGLSQELYRVTLGQPTSVERIFSNFERVREPAWSPDGETIAFVGNERIDQSEGWQDLVLLPWDLYLMDADGGNVRVLFPQIGNPYNMRWSPHGEWLFFSGSRRPVGADGGIWMLNVETLEIYRIWPENAFFDLSPDGERMVIIEEEREDDESVRMFPVVYEVHFQ